MSKGSRGLCCLGDGSVLIGKGQGEGRSGSPGSRKEVVDTLPSFLSSSLSFYISAPRVSSFSSLLFSKRLICSGVCSCSKEKINGKNWRSFFFIRSLGRVGVGMDMGNDGEENSGLRDEGTL